jgi:hypothetical protein
LARPDIAQEPKIALKVQVKNVTALFKLKYYIKEAEIFVSKSK